MKVEFKEYSEGDVGIWLEPETVDDAAQLSKMVRCAKNRVDLTLHGDLSASIFIRKNKKAKSYVEKTIGSG